MLLSIANITDTLLTAHPEMSGFSVQSLKSSVMSVTVNTSRSEIAHVS